MRTTVTGVTVKTRIRAGSLTNNHNEGIAPIYGFEPWRATN